MKNSSELAERLLTLAHAALLDAGHPELVEYINLKEGDTLPHITSPCPLPHTITQALALAHQAAGHLVTIYRVEDAAGFDCIDCGLISQHNKSLRELSEGYMDFKGD